MKSKLLILLTVILLSCEKEEIIEPDSNNPLIGYWYMEKYTYQDKEYISEFNTCDDKNAFYRTLSISKENYQEFQCLAGSGMDFNYQWEVKENKLFLWIGNAPKAEFEYSVDEQYFIKTEGGRTDYYIRK